MIELKIIDNMLENFENMTINYVNELKENEIVEDWVNAFIFKGESKSLYLLKFEIMKLIKKYELKSQRYIDFKNFIEIEFELGKINDTITTLLPYYFINILKDLHIEAPIYFKHIYIEGIHLMMSKLKISEQFIFDEEDIKKDIKENNNSLKNCNSFSIEELLNDHMYMLKKSVNF